MEGRRGVLNYRHSKDDTLSIARDNLLDGVLDRQGNIWLASSEGVDLFSPATGKRIPYLTFGAHSRGERRHAALARPDGYSLDQYGRRAVSTGSARNPGGSPTIHTDTPEPHHGDLKQSNEHADGEYWICSYGTVSQLDVQTRSFVKSIDVLRGARGTYWDSNMRTSFLDEQGILWYGIWGPGLYKVDLATRQVTNFRYPDQLHAGDAAVRSIAPGSGDSLWIAAAHDGLWKFDPASGRFQTRVQDDV